MQQRTRNEDRQRIENIMQNLENSAKYDEQTLELIRSDLEYGIGNDRLKQYYYKSKYTLEQMKIYSQCLRNDYTDEVLKVVCSPKLSAQQMRLAADYYEKKVPLECIRDITDSEGTVAAMKAAFNNILKSMNSIDSHIPVDREEVKELVEKVKEAVGSINSSKAQYETIISLIRQMNHQNADADTEQLIRKNAEQEIMIDEQQTSLNEASKKIREQKKMISSMETELREKEKEIAELKKQMGDFNVQTAAKVSDNSVYEKSNAEKIPVYYTVPVESGGMVRYVEQIEKSSPRHKHTNIVSLFADIGIKKKDKQDMVKILAGTELDSAQLEQIKNAMGRGLTHEQITQLIVNRVEAEKMKVIIEIAVIENSKKQEE